MELNPFSPMVLMKTPNVYVVLIGKPAVGSTTLLKDLFQQVGKNMPKPARLFTQTDQAKWTDLDVRIEAETTNGGGLVIVDNLYDFSWALVKEKRNSVWVAMSYSRGISPQIREKIDYLFLFKETHIDSCKKIYDLYCCKFFATFAEFHTVFKKYTQNYQCLVIHLASKSDNLLEQVFWYKAA